MLKTCFSSEIAGRMFFFWLYLCSDNSSTVPIPKPETLCTTIATVVSCLRYVKKSNKANNRIAFYQKAAFQSFEIKFIKKVIVNHWLIYQIIKNLFSLLFFIFSFFLNSFIIEANNEFKVLFSKIMFVPQIGRSRKFTT